MSANYGYMGRILWVDLSEMKVWEEELSENTTTNFLGGWGIGGYILFQRMEHGCDPLGPKNHFAVGTGPFTLSGVPSTSRYHAMAKSPLTGYWGGANSGGRFANALKASGFDMIVITGKAEKPVYLLVIDGRAELKDASSLWGLDTVTTEKEIQDKHGRDTAVICIGPAGERLSRIAGILHEGGRAAARSGLGAVMGSKKLKAIACGGKQRPLLHSPERVRVLAQQIRRNVQKSSSPMLNVLRTCGTAGGLEGAIALQDAPIKNWAGTNVTDFPKPKWHRIGWESIKQYERKKYACAGCSIACGGILKMKWGEVHKPEYETLAAFGPMCLIDNVEAIIRANDICNKYGLDTISAGATIAFAIECFENGILTIGDTDGIELRWGDAESVIKILEKMAVREGIGDVLADGAKWAAEKIGRGANELAMHVGGEMLPMHDPRFAPGFGATYVCDPTPARHTRGGTYFIEKNMLSREATLIRELKIVDSLNPYDAARGHWHMLMSARQYIVECSGMCLFAADHVHYPFLDLLRSITGWELTAEELINLGRRIATLLHMFNLREGFRPSEFTLPPRVRGVPPLKEGPLKGVTVDEEFLKKRYYEAMGFDVNTGTINRKVLGELGLLNSLLETEHK